MIVGLPREIKTEEYRVALTPAAAKAFTALAQFQATGRGVSRSGAHDHSRRFPAAVEKARPSRRSAGEASCEGGGPR